MRILKSSIGVILLLPYVMAYVRMKIKFYSEYNSPCLVGTNNKENVGFDFKLYVRFEFKLLLDLNSNSLLNLVSNSKTIKGFLLEVIDNTIQ